MMWLHNMTNGNNNNIYILVYAQLLLSFICLFIYM